MAKSTSNLRFDKIQSSIESGIALAQDDRRNRWKAIGELERLAGAKVCMYYSQRNRTLSQFDTLPFYQMLKSMGAVRDLDLIVVSPGGDGTAAETILDLCRKHCTGRLRVVVPLYAKSAATLIALGADEIVMGETSELGPIDAQVFIIENNAEQQVSAEHFLRARDEAIKNLGSDQAEIVQAAQIQLASLGPAFLQHCSDLMAFAKDFAGKQLRVHMLKDEHDKDEAACESQIERVVSNLTSSSRRLFHGRMITAQEIRDDPDLRCLKVAELASDDPYWLSLNELLLRTEIVATSNNIGKVLFAKGFQLVSA